MDARSPSVVDRPSRGGAFGPRIALFSLFGFKVQLDLSWLFLAVLVTWSLATAVFPSEAPGLPGATYWWMGVAGTIGLLFSLVFHELSHSLVARRYGTTIRGITLFIFGGVAEMAEEPRSANAELWMALAGPAASFLLAGLLYELAIIGEAENWPATVLGVASYLARINAVLAAFNLVPAYPLDGGRVLRAALWRWKGDIRWATRRASQAGNAFGYLLIFLGFLEVVTGFFIGGMWLALIGLFLRGAAQGSYAQVLTQQLLTGAPVAQFMTPNPISVPREMTIKSFVEDYIYRYHHEQFPVLRGDEILGYAGIREVKQVAREAWPLRTVGEVVTRCSSTNTVEADTDAMRALALMSQTGSSRLLVTSQGRLVGILTLRDLLSFIAIKLELEAA